MLNEKMERALNEQINRELFSAYLYLSMAQWFETQNYRGFAHWLRVQFSEEMNHAHKFIHYINERNGRVLLKEIKGPRSEWSSPQEVFDEVLKHEQHITASIHELYHLAGKENDPASQSFLKWFIDEQVEEEAQSQEIVDQVKMIGDSKHGLFLIDRQLADRKKD